MSGKGEGDAARKTNMIGYWATIIPLALKDLSMLAPIGGL